MKQLQQYTYTLPANGSVQIPAPNDNFIITACTGPVTVRGDTFGKFANLTAGQGLKGVPFNRLELFDESGAPNTVTVLLSPVEFVNQVFSGSVAITGAVALDSATINALARPGLPGAHWNNQAAIGANVATAVFTAGSNPNGAIIWSAEAHENFAAPAIFTFVAKATAPASPADGEVIAQSLYDAIITGSEYMGIRMRTPTRIAAGLGLYYISSAAVAANKLRSCRYTLL